jgi:mannosyl-oligosaccharide glucosidase
MSKETGEKVFEGHTGYLNFWPFFLNVLDPSDMRFKASFDMLVDEKSAMLTDFGVRSLSKNDPYYRQGDNYWTSPIWMNINFLILKSLHGYSTDPAVETTLRESIKATYEKLRDGVVGMISNEYERTGFIWEVYDDQVGEGRDNHPFTGWSALYLNILSEMY